MASSALAASCWFIQPKPMRVELRETGPLLCIRPLERMKPCDLSFSDRAGSGTEGWNFTQIESPPSGTLKSMMPEKRSFSWPIQNPGGGDIRSGTS